MRRETYVDKKIKVQMFILKLLAWAIGLVAVIGVVQKI
jgi:hypothetical protein